MKRPARRRGERDAIDAGDAAAARRRAGAHVAAGAAEIEDAGALRDRIEVARVGARKMELGVVVRVVGVGGRAVEAAVVEEAQLLTAGHQHRLR